MNLKNPSGGAALSLLLIAATMIPNAHAAPGDLDPSFGTGGKVTTDFSGNLDIGNATAVQSDGKIVVVGFTRVGSDAATEDFALARYNTDGSLDSTFGTGGKVTTDFPPRVIVDKSADRANAVAIQVDGKIVVAGSQQNTSTMRKDIAIARYNTNGTLDASFGNAGRGPSRIHPFLGDAQANAVAIQSDGKIVVAGRSPGTKAGTVDFTLVRYNTDGSFDQGFGSFEAASADFFSGNDAALAVVIQLDGKIVAAGSASRGDATSPDFALARFNADGSLDTTYGTGGKVVTDFNASLDGIASIALQQDGKIVAAGFTFITSTNNDNFALVRYNTDGSLDTTFGSGGKVITDFSPTTDDAHAVLVQPDGKIVAAGIADGAGSGLDFALASYNPDGSPDSNFGTGGKVTTTFSAAADFVNALVLQRDRKLVAVGGAGSNGDFALARYFTGITLPPTQLLNISTRLGVLAGDNALIGGFIITGSDTKRVIIRGIGPSLTNRGVSGALQDPTLDLFQGATLLASNDNWKATQQAEIEATTIPPSNDAESAIVRTLAPGAYTAILRGKGDTTGIGLVEAYDLDSVANSKLANISTRGFVNAGDSALIGGVIIGPGGGATRVVVRAIGPSLANSGVNGSLQNPVLELRNGDGTLAAQNDNWKDTQQEQITATTLAPTDDRESAIVISLFGGDYTAIVRGVGDTTGIGLVEVYNLP